MRILLFLAFTAGLFGFSGCESSNTGYRPPIAGSFDEEGFKAVVDRAASTMGDATPTQTITSPEAIMLPAGAQHLYVVVDTSGSMREGPDYVLKPLVNDVISRVIEVASDVERVWFIDTDGRALIGGKDGVASGGGAAHAAALGKISEDLVFSGSDPTFGIIAALRDHHDRAATGRGPVDIVVISDEVVVHDVMPFERLMSIGANPVPESGRDDAPSSGSAGFGARVHFIQLPVGAEESEALLTAEALSIYSEIVSHKFHGFSYRVAVPAEP